MVGAMTPFAEKLRTHREKKGLTAKALAAKLDITPAYLSALEHGHRGRPNKRFVHQVCQALGLIWDEADELQRLAELSHPKVTIDTAGLSATHTLLANRLAERIGRLSEDEASAINERLGP